MTGETNLAKLLKNMEPILREGTYVFAHVPSAHEQSVKDCCIQFFREDEGMAAYFRSVVNKHVLAWCKENKHD
jgi:hypothetical protein